MPSGMHASVRTAHQLRTARSQQSKHALATTKASRCLAKQAAQRSRRRKIAACSNIGRKTICGRVRMNKPLPFLVSAGIHRPFPNSAPKLQLSGSATSQPPSRAMRTNWMFAMHMSALPERVFQQVTQTGHGLPARHSTSRSVLSTLSCHSALTRRIWRSRSRGGESTSRRSLSL